MIAYRTGAAIWAECARMLLMTKSDIERLKHACTGAFRLVALQTNGGPQ